MEEEQIIGCVRDTCDTCAVSILCRCLCLSVARLALISSLHASAVNFRRDKILPYIQSREMRGGSGAMELKAQSMYDKIEEKLKAGPLNPKLHHQHHYQH